MKCTACSFEWAEKSLYSRFGSLRDCSTVSSCSPVISSDLDVCDTQVIFFTGPPLESLSSGLVFRSLNFLFLPPARCFVVLSSELVFTGAGPICSSNSSSRVRGLCFFAFFFFPSGLRTSGELKLPFLCLLLRGETVCPCSRGGGGEEDLNDFAPVETLSVYPEDSTAVDSTANGVGHRFKAHKEERVAPRDTGRSMPTDST